MARSGHRGARRQPPRAVVASLVRPGRPRDARHRGRAGLAHERSVAIASVNPATGERLREFAPLSDRETEERLTRAAAAFVRWRDTPIRERTAVVRRAAEIL